MLRRLKANHSPVDLSYLLSPSLRNIELYEKAISLLLHSSDEDLSRYEREYASSLHKHYHQIFAAGNHQKMIKNKNNETVQDQQPPPCAIMDQPTLPSFPCHFLWHVHTLHPLKYASFVSLIESKPDYHCGVVGLNLIEACRNHLPFMQEIVSLPHSSLLTSSSPPNEGEEEEGHKGKGDDTPAAVREMNRRALVALDEYSAFLSSLRGGARRPVPSPLVDHMWHTHMNHPHQYARDCLRVCGVLIDHLVSSSEKD